MLYITYYKLYIIYYVLYSMYYIVCIMYHVFYITYHILHIVHYISYVFYYPNRASPDTAPLVSTCTGIGEPGRWAEENEVLQDKHLASAQLGPGFLWSFFGVTFIFFSAAMYTYISVWIYIYICICCIWIFFVPKYSSGVPTVN